MKQKIIIMCIHNGIGKVECNDRYTEIQIPDTKNMKKSDKTERLIFSGFHAQGVEL